VRAVEQQIDGPVVVHDLIIIGGTGKLDVNLDKLQRLVFFIIGRTGYTTIPASYRLELKV
jgi:hypothetical protein